MHIICAFNQINNAAGVIIGGEMNALLNTIQVCISHFQHSRLEWSGFSHLSFYITLQLVLHFSEFAPDETLQAVTLSPMEPDRFSPLRSLPVLCLIYCNSVVTDIFCTDARQPLHNNPPSHFLCVLVGGCGGQSYLLKNNELLPCAKVVDCKAAKCLLISFSVTVWLSAVWKK